MKKYFLILSCIFLFQSHMMAYQKAPSSSETVLHDFLKMDTLLKHLDVYAAKRWLFLQSVGSLSSSEQTEIAENLSRLANKSSGSERNLLLFLSSKIQKPLLNQGIALLKMASPATHTASDSMVCSNPVLLANPKDLTVILQAVKELAPVLNAFETQCAALQKKQKKFVIKTLKKEIKNPKNKQKSYYKDLKSVIYYAIDVADRHLPYQIVKTMKGIGSTITTPMQIVVKPVVTVFCKWPAHLVGSLLKSPVDSKPTYKLSEAINPVQMNPTYA